MTGMHKLHKLLALLPYVLMEPGIADGKLWSTALAYASVMFSSVTAVTYGPICGSVTAYLCPPSRSSWRFVLFRKDKQQTNINSIEAFTDLYVEIYPRKNFKALDAKLGALMQKVRLMQAHICWINQRKLKLNSYSLLTKLNDQLHMFSCNP